MKKISLLQAALTQYNLSNDTDDEEEEFFEIISYENELIDSECPANCKSNCKNLFQNA